VTFEEVIADMAREAATAVWRFGDEPISLTAAADGVPPKLAADVWVYDPTFERTLLVEHPIRGWVMPGGRVEPGETVRAAAARELFEEVGVRVPEADLRVAAVHTVPDEWVGPRAWCLSFEAILDPGSALIGEPAQEPAWWSLDASWRSVYPDDRDRLRQHANRRRSQA